jgi:O-antigen/teichoic acid export membrane protein
VKQNTCIRNSRRKGWKTVEKLISEDLNWLKRVDRKSWINKGFWAVLDQALFSGANFIVNILLARWLPPEEYGAFAVALSIYYLLLGFHTAFISGPMMVFGAGKFAPRFSRYYHVLRFFHWGFSFVISVLLGLFALITYKTHLSSSLQGLALSIPWMLYLWFLRQVFYVKEDPGTSILGMLFYSITLIIIFFSLKSLNILSAIFVFLGMGLASIIGSVVLLSRLNLGSGKRNEELLVKSVFWNHWSYGRWLALHNLVNSFYSDGILLILGIFHGLAVTGIFRALQNLTLPIFQYLTAWNRLILPVMTRKYYEKGKEELRRVAFFFTVFCVLSKSIYLITVCAFRQTFVGFLGNVYIAYSDLLIIWLLGPIILSFGKGVEMVTYVLEKPQVIFYSYIVGTIAALGLFILLIPPFGLWGAVLARIGSFIVQTGYLVSKGAKNYEIL